jgi:hypothetical protein
MIDRAGARGETVEVSSLRSRRHGKLDGSWRDVIVVERLL